MAVLYSAAWVIVPTHTANIVACTRYIADVCAVAYLGSCRGIFFLSIISADAASIGNPADCAGVAAIRYGAAVVLTADAAALIPCGGNRSAGCAISHVAKVIITAHTTDIG